MNVVNYKVRKPIPELADFVESFWMLANPFDEEKEVVVVPDGRIDLCFSISATEPYHVMLAGLDSEPACSSIAPNSVMFAISFNLLAVEYLLDNSVSSLLNERLVLSDDFWGMAANDLTDFDAFCTKATLKMLEALKPDVDKRKRKLFEMVYSTMGAVTIQEISDTVHWSSRQINRYFSQQFGLPLKTYCTILRFRASFPQITHGKLFPEQNFADQAHFIREVKKYAGATPKELKQNKNDRFIQFSVLKQK
ncbi:AraC family transcriptional regulator [Cytophagaceae bacterium YF14B1]|uniref:AraC family transcriptional regulator n=1 Tax=Xanthocytophaga flava TaxID=3048013 RepID=A0AAE3QV11_9BACT|nr:AraC family transcriptional regulator [Xanthocytophaga flavus]MDJ1485526.1 AraC family transcriptional regulator [Xanthocytophaga flavus]